MNYTEYGKQHHISTETRQVKLTLILPSKHAQRRRNVPVLMLTSTHYKNNLDLEGAKEIYEFKYRLDELCAVLKAKYDGLEISSTGC